MRLEISFSKENGYFAHLESDPVVCLVPRCFCSPHFCKDSLPGMSSLPSKGFLFEQGNKVHFHSLP